jgi:predicted transcriptional regulator
MVALEAAMTVETAELTDLAPNEAAQVLLRRADELWLSELQRSLDRQRARAGFGRILAVWNLNQSDAAALFGVTRQAIAKWRSRGVPAGRIEAVADLSAATDLLVRHLKRDRIPAVVRRGSVQLGGQSLLDLVNQGHTREVLLACRAMFTFGDAH